MLDNEKVLRGKKTRRQEGGGKVSGMIHKTHPP